MVIDWSKAPEGATHWDSRGNACSLGFMKPSLRAGEWEYAGCGGHWVLYGLADTNLISAMIPRPAPWSGEGLPPVGTVCMTEYEGEDLKIKILAYASASGNEDGPHYVMSCQIVGDRESQLFAWLAHLCEFFPIKTPEQIAAEERDKAVHQMGLDAGFHGSVQDFAKRLYALGYRKVEGGAA